MASISKLIIDTGTWTKLDTLEVDGVISKEFIELLYEHFDVIITPEIETEMQYYNVSSWIKNKTFVIPVEDIEAKKKVERDGFDEADASIFGIDTRDCIILSEDRPLIKYGSISLMNFMFFAEFLVLLFESSLVSKNNLYNLNKHLYSIRNIGKNLFKDIKQKTHWMT
ncbi:MAG: hypothetical protein EU530_10580 [Promethearchaeota archaeon]|nr:MAG: hypothetical protein EU530_10580 [Candidatus Lokiarchaeota archaeon]